VTSVWRKRTTSWPATVMANSDSLRAECFRDRYTRKATPWRRRSQNTLEKNEA
jgi:hypothetical protein